MKTRIDWSISAKNAIDILMVIAFNLYITFCNIDIFTILIWPIYEQREQEAFPSFNIFFNV